MKPATGGAVVKRGRPREKKPQEPGYLVVEVPAPIEEDDWVTVESPDE